jgi:hypothetical protein
MKSIATKELGVINALNFENMFSSGSSSFYALMGRSIPWANTSNTSVLDDITIETPYDTTQYKFDTLKNGFFLRRITSNDLHPVIPRVDWTNGQMYVAYDQTANLFVKSVSTQVSSGNVNVAFSLANTVIANGINFNAASPALTIGSIIQIGNEAKEVVKINTAGDFLQVNTGFSTSYTSANLFKIVTSTVQYSNKFYVRNSKDQIFKCLFNNNDVVSTIMPQITLAGQLPENPYIVTSDGYKWKYMYTIPAGLKQKFFTNDYMPVTTETITTENAVDGRIDIVEILNGGSGYYNGLSVNNYSPTSNIISITGDGTGAQLTANVVNGVITAINILDGGNNYTTATITVNDPLVSLVNTAASLRAVISPKNGHGSDPIYELGASYRMLSVEFDGDIGGVLPVSGSGTDDFRQIALIRNPKLASNAATAFSTTGYTMCTKIQVGTASTFTPDTIVYVGSSYSTSIFSGRVVHFDNVQKILYLNALVGDSSQTTLANQTIYEKDNVGVNGTIVQVTPPDINILSGQILYIENRAKVIRNPDQIESTRVVFAF